jgi:DNA-binding IscR family transcriptional regulator
MKRSNKRSRREKRIEEATEVRIKEGEGGGERLWRKMHEVYLLDVFELLHEEIFPLLLRNFRLHLLRPRLE